MKVLCDEYKSCPQASAEVNETYLKDEKEWHQIQNQIKEFLNRLQVLKADWSEYCLRYIYNNYNSI